jgi:hypothetical protein
VFPFASISGSVVREIVRIVIAARTLVKGKSRLDPHRRAGSDGAESYQRDGASRRRLGTLGDDTIRRERAIFAAPANCLERIHHLREVLGVQQLIGWMNIGGIPHDRVLRSMRRLAGRVLPVLG